MLEWQSHVAAEKDLEQEHIIKVDLFQKRRAQRLQAQILDALKQYCLEKR